MEIKKCLICSEEKEIGEFYSRPNLPCKTYPYCKPCSNALTIKKQRERKEWYIAYKGGKCELCGYDKCPAALEFHHRDPAKKDFEIARLKTYSFDLIKPELDKCVLVCSNCHREVHAGMHESLRL